MSALFFLLAALSQVLAISVNSQALENSTLPALLPESNLTLTARRLEDQFYYYTYDEETCQACITRAWSHCKISDTEYLCCPPNNETGICMRTRQIRYKYCTDFVQQQALKRWTCISREPCNQNSTLYHFKFNNFDIQQGKWGFFDNEWKRYCTYMIQANSSLEGQLVLKIPLLVGADFYVMAMPKDEYSEDGIVYKADMYVKNTFKVPVDWSFLVLYEPVWYQAGYF